MSADDYERLLYKPKHHYAIAWRRDLLIDMNLLAERPRKLSPYGSARVHILTELQNGECAKAIYKGGVALRREFVGWHRANGTFGPH